MSQGTPEKYNARQRRYQKARYRRRMDEAIALLGGRCAWCSRTDRLHIDHIHPVTKVKQLSLMHNLSRERWADELVKCQLLCTWCHGKKTTRIEGHGFQRGNPGYGYRRASGQ